MDVDGPSNLKRSSSAPMINELNNVSSSSTSRALNNQRGDINIFSLFSAAALTRTRRFSASCSPLAAPESPCLSISRVTQLRREERLEAVHGRELEHERELHSQMQMSQSCEDLALLPSFSNNNGTKDVVMGRCSSPSSPVGTGLLGSFSPTRDRATPTRTHALPPLLLRRPLSPSPTRKTFMSRRSLSPIAMRPSALTPVKRKFELDHSDGEHMGSPCSSSSSSYLSPPAKRLSIGTTSLAFGPDGQRSAPLSPGGGRFLFRPLTSSYSLANTSSSASPSLVSTGANSNSSSLRDEPMLDEEEEMLLATRHKQVDGDNSNSSQPSTQAEQQQTPTQNSTIKDTIMSSFEPS